MTVEVQALEHYYVLGCELRRWVPVYLTGIWRCIEINGHTSLEFIAGDGKWYNEAALRVVTTYMNQCGG